MDKRELRPIIYYASPKDRMGNDETFQTYMEAARILEANWDRAFRRAAAAAMGKSPSDVPQMFYVCENPVPAGAPSACGPEGFEARFGDLRYSFLYTITDPVPNGLLGYGPSSADPETGEIISANSNTYSAAVETLAQRAMDTMDLLVGEATIENVIKGEDVLNYMKDNIPYPAKAYRKQGALEAELQGVVQTGEVSKGAFERPTQALTGTLQRMSAQGGLPAFKGDRIKAATDILEQYPDLESTILDNPEVQADLVGLLPEPLREKAMEDSAFARTASRSVLTRFTEGRSYQQSRIEWASRKNMYLVEFMDRPMLSLALREHQKREGKIIQLVAAGKSEVEARRQANDEVRRRLRQAIWRATSEHELGHTVGLRHNFQGSFDAINYFDDYWTLRQETLSIKQGTSQVVPRTPADLLNVALGSELQLSAGMRELEYSSIMDYGGKMNADISGIGKYDEAAILFAYSGGREPGYVEVFDNLRDSTLNFPGSDGQTVPLRGAAYDLVITNAQHIHPGVPNYTERVHYSTVPLRFGEGNTVTNVIADGLDKLRTRRLMKWSDVKAENDRIAALLKNNPNPSSADLAGAPLEVPYMFCTDDHVGYVLSCNRFDRGPDYLEMAQTKIEDYWNSYYFTHFKRDRYNFTSDGAFGGAYTTFSDLNAIYKHWAFALANQSKPGQQALSKFTYDASMQDTWTMAVMDGINANLAVMTVPPAGFFRYRNLAPSGLWDIVSEGVDFDEVTPEGIAVLQDYYSDSNNFSPPATRFAVMKRGQARRMYSRYDFKSGFGFFERMLESGHYNDQMGAMFAAIEPQAQFLGTDIDADFNRYNIPYYLMFPDEMTQTFSSLWSGAEETVRPTMYLTRNDGGQVTNRPALYFKTFVPGQKYIAGFDYPKTENQTCTGGQTTGCLSSSQFPARADFQLTWTSRIYSLWLGLAMFNVNYDLDYAKANQVFKVGGAESFQVAPGYTAYELADIASGSRYVAVQKTTATQDTSAVRLIKMANAYLQVVENPTQCPPPSITGADGSEIQIADCMRADERGNPALVEQRRREYREYFQDQVRDLDLMRGFYAAFGRAF